MLANKLISLLLQLLIVKQSLAHIALVVTEYDEAIA